MFEHYVTLLHNVHITKFKHVVTVNHLGARVFTLLNKASTTRYSFFVYTNRFELEITYMIFNIKSQIKRSSQLK